MLGMFIFSLLFCWAYVTFCHEAAHLAVAYLKDGLKPKGLYPYWHWMNKYTGEVKMWNPLQGTKDPFEGEGDFAFGRFKIHGSLPLGKKELVHIAPVIADVGNSAVAVYFLFTGTGIIFPVILLACCTIDASLFIKGYFGTNPGLDGYRWRRGIKI